MRKKIATTLSLLLLLSVVPIALAQKSETTLVLDKIIEHAENASLYRNNVDWTALKFEVYSLAKDADSIPQLKPAINHLLKELNDDHSRVFYNNTYLAYFSGYEKDHLKTMDSEVYNDIQSGQVYEFKAELLKDDIGYVRIVGLPMGDNQKMSADIQNAVCEVMGKGATSWIIDLRYNGGGNMFPMVEGLTSIIGDGIVGGTMGVTKDESSIWKIEDGNFYYDKQNVAIPNPCKVQTTPKIAVLTSMYTASSGEALATILKHRKNTSFFGGKTMGKITATDWTQIDPLTAMMISVSYYKDRAGNVYKDYIDVDEEIAFNPKNTLAEDACVLRAMEWLRNAK